jgi:hypothetical protein
MSNHINEFKLRRLFADRGFQIHEARKNKHWWCRIARVDGGPLFSVAVALTPSDCKFEYAVDKAIRKSERPRYLRVMRQTFPARRN